MSYTEYLRTSFYSKEQLLALSAVDKEAFSLWQAQGVMPKPSYRLNISLESESFFGPHSETKTIEYYAKGCLYWLGVLQALPESDQVYGLFKKKYIAQINLLRHKGFLSASFNKIEKQDQRITQAWKDFIAGTYGVCTKTGLPEEIASKAIGIAIVNSYLNIGQLEVNAQTKLFAAVDLLDEVVAEFAPHERKLSSRHKYIDEFNKTRERYKVGLAPLTQQ